MASISKEFSGLFPEEFLREAMVELKRSYDDAPGVGAVAGLGDDHGRWHLPLVRRAMFEEQLLALANKYRGSMVARTAFASKDNTPYTVVESGPFFLTISHLDRKGPLPPEAKFRRANSRLNDGLFADLYEPDDGPRYAILTHRSSADGRHIRSAHVVFPDASYKGFITRIDLMARYSVASAATPTVRPVATPVERIIDEAQPVLKKKTSQKRKAE